MMFLRPGNAYKDFIVEGTEADVSARGRVRRSYDNEATVILKGVLADATEQDKYRFAQKQHPITHTIVQQGEPIAKRDDKLILGSRLFFVQGVNDVAALGHYTIYHVEERFDRHG